MNKGMLLREMAKQLVACIDLTLLSSSETSVDIEVLCEKAQTAYGNVAAVCVLPRWVELANSQLNGTSINIATVVNFPSPTLSLLQCQQAIHQAVAAGANEIDVVMPYDLLAEGGDSRVAKILAACREAAAEQTLKVIIESGELKAAELIARATQLVVDSGADFVKTSTGKTPVGATLQAAEVMLGVLKKTGFKTGLKLSGGIRDTVTAYEYVQLVKRYLGDQWHDPAHFRIGASQLLQALIDQIEQPL